MLKPQASYRLAIDRYKSNFIEELEETETATEAEAEAE